MARLIGELGAFNPDSEKISTYLERVAVFMTANEVADAKKAAVLLSVIGKTNYALLEGLMAPGLPREKTYEEIVAALKKHYEPAPLQIAERFHFYKRSQGLTESIADFAAALRKLAIKCDFGDFLDDALRDRLVCGLWNEPIQKRLLTEKDLTNARAIEIAQGMEAADQRTKEMHGASPSVLQVREKACYRCGKVHEGKCRFLTATCHKCGKVGHIASVCRSKKPGSKPKPKGKAPTQWVQTSDNDQLDQHLFTVGSSGGNQAIQVEVSINGQPIVMVVDTGAAVSIIPDSLRRSKFSEISLLPCSTVLQTYTGEALEVLGKVVVDVQYQQQPAKKLALVVVNSDGPCLFGRDWLAHFRLDWKQIANVNVAVPDELTNLLAKYDEVFAEGLGTIEPFEAKIVVKDGTQPKFCRARPVPLAMRAPVEEELSRLEREGVLTKVDHSDWATPVVVVPKKNGTVRLCGDYSVTLNQVIDVDQYPLPSSAELFAMLAGGKLFTTLDLANAYHQLRVNEDSQKFLTINTQRGLYQYARLPFGIASASAIFQKTMDRILQGIDGVLCYIDDVIISAKSEEEHLQILEKVLQRFKQYGVRARKVKCKFLTNSVEYLGHIIDAEGQHPLPSKLKAITGAPEPKNVVELRSFLGLLNYYGRFIANLSTILHPLNSLLRHDAPWNWTKQCKQAFQQAKEALVSSQVLTHYDSALPLVLAGDASAYGVGAVISHITSDGQEHPIAFASRTLSKAEQNYSQIEKEALSLVYGISKFHCYLYGRKFILETDHKPLTVIFGQKKGVPVMAAARLQRWAIQLGAYSYEIRFRSTQAHANADALSRLPLSDAQPEGFSKEPSLFNIQQIESLPVTAAELKRESATDPEVSKVLLYLQEGWPPQVEADLKAYHKRRDELTSEVGCLLWGTRAVIPRKLRQRLLSELHRDHPGITRMKEVSRSYMWWPGLDQDIEQLVKSCPNCRAVKHSPSVTPLRPWTWPSKPWERIHVDFAGPFQGTMLLVLVDAHSKWPEVYPMSNTTVASTIEVLRKIFASHGLPEQLVSDNGPQFTSSEFAVFMKGNGIHHVRSAPYHPATNGLAERFVQTVKQALKANVSDGLSLSHRLSNFLLCYRSTPHATTGVSPSSLFLKRQLRTRLDLLRPSTKTTVLQKQAQQKESHDSRARERQWFVGQSVMVRNLRPGPAWVPGVIVERLGPLSYLVETSEQFWKRHAEQIREVENPPAEHSEPAQPAPVETHSSTEFQPPPEWSYPTLTPSEPPTTAESSGGAAPPPEPAETPPLSTPGTTLPRRSTRHRRPPDRLGL